MIIAVVVLVAVLVAGEVVVLALVVVAMVFVEEVEDGKAMIVLEVVVVVLGVWALQGVSDVPTVVIDLAVVVVLVI